MADYEGFKYSANLMDYGSKVPDDSKNDWSESSANLLVYPDEEPEEKKKEKQANLEAIKRRLQDLET